MARMLPLFVMLCGAVFPSVACEDDDDIIVGNEDGGVSGGGGSAGSGGSGGGSSGAAGAGGAAATDAGIGLDAGFGADGGLTADGGIPAEGGLLADGGSVLSDGEIVAVMRALNTGEVEQAEAAQPRLDDPDVVAFAQMMIDAHTDANADLDALNIAASANQLALLLAEDSDIAVSLIEAAPASAVDPVYIATQVEGHLGASILLRDQLRPQADDPDLQTYLDEMQTAVDMHLNTAIGLQQSLSLPDAGLLDAGN